MLDPEIQAMAASIEALQRVMVRLEADMLALKACSPEARFEMFRGIEQMQSPSQLAQQMGLEPVRRFGSTS